MSDLVHTVPSIKCSKDLADSIRLTFAAIGAWLKRGEVASTLSQPTIQYLSNNLSSGTAEIMVPERKKPVSVTLVSYYPAWGYQTDDAKWADFGLRIYGRDYTSLTLRMLSQGEIGNPAGEALEHLTYSALGCRSARRPLSREGLLKYGVLQRIENLGFKVLTVQGLRDKEPMDFETVREKMERMQNFFALTLKDELIDQRDISEKTVKIKGRSL